MIHMKTLPRPVVAVAPVLKVLVIALFVIATVASNGTVEAKENPTDVETLIRKLSANSFIDRERATVALLEAGETAELALRKTVVDGDRELRIRSRQILDVIQQRRRKTELLAFRNGELPQEQLVELPGWKQFSTKYGDSPVARQFFAEMLDAEWALLREYYSKTEHPNALRTLTANRFQSIQQSIGYDQYPLGMMLTLFFLGTESPEHFDLHGSLYSFVRHRKLNVLLSSLAIAKTGVNESQIARKIVGDWLVATGGRQINDRLALQTTLIYRMYDEGSVIAKRVLQNKDALVLSKSSAMQSIVIRNDLPQAKLIEPYLEDRSRLGITGQRERQVRDVALACLMHLHGFDVKKIGVKVLRPGTHSAFDYNTLGFITDADRQRAFKQYEKLRKDKKQKTTDDN